MLRNSSQSPALKLRRDPDQPRIGGAHRGMRVDRDRQHREQDDDEHPGAEPGADPDDEQRQERHLRRGVEGRQERPTA